MWLREVVEQGARECAVELPHSEDRVHVWTGCILSGGSTVAAEAACGRPPVFVRRNAWPASMQVSSRKTQAQSHPSPHHAARIHPRHAEQGARPRERHFVKQVDDRADVVRHDANTVADTRRRIGAGNIEKAVLLA